MVREKPVSDQLFEPSLLLQCVAVCCSVLRYLCTWEKKSLVREKPVRDQLFEPSLLLQRVAVCSSVVLCVAVCCSVLHRVAVCCSAYVHEKVNALLVRILPVIYISKHCNTLQHTATHCCNTLQHSNAL